MIELDAVKKQMPKWHRSLLTQEYLDKIEQSVQNSEIAEQFKENFITYLNVLSKGKYKMDDYVRAVKYVSFKLLGYSNIKAYAAVFPGRYQRLVDEGSDRIDAYVSAYARNKLVNLIYEQTMVPTYVLNAPLHQEALNELANMIKDPAVRGMVKVKACEAILAYTKPPEVVKGEITIGIEQQDTISELREVTEHLANVHRALLEKGNKSLAQIAEANIIDTTSREVEKEEVDDEFGE